MLGLMAAAPILLEGRMFSAKKANQIGIVDEIVDEKNLLNKAYWMARRYIMISVLGVICLAVWESMDVSPHSLDQII